MAVTSPARSGKRNVPWSWFGWCTAALGLYVLGGWVGAAVAMMLPGFPLQPTNSIGSVTAIFEHNLVVLGLISAGFLTLGLTTAAGLFLNGTFLGFIALEMIERHQVPSLVTAVGPQLPFELGAYVIAAGATLRLTWSVWWPLLARRARNPLAWRAWLAAEGAAVTLLFAGAVVEVVFSRV
jgi:uncharacterized membrane protein SpoIIM required for sporulation